MKIWELCEWWGWVLMWMVWFEYWVIGVVEIKVVFVVEMCLEIFGDCFK